MIFNSDDYDHYKFSDLDAIKEKYPCDETNITLDCFNPAIIKKRATDSEKLFNTKRIGIELMKYKNMNMLPHFSHSLVDIPFLF